MARQKSRAVRRIVSAAADAARSEGQGSSPALRRAVGGVAGGEWVVRCTQRQAIRAGARALGEPGAG
jgi:hypothetical protein